MKSKEFRAMGTDIQFLVSETEATDNVQEAIEVAKSKMLHLESLLSRFQERSDISRINAEAGQWVHVSAESLEIIRLADEAFLRTKGFFNPFMGHVIENLGYRVTFEHIASPVVPPVTVSIPYVPPVTSPLTFDETGLRVRLNHGHKIDLGGIAKGWIVEKTSEVLSNHGISNFVCNAGGDLVCKGSNEGNPWVVGIADPLDVSKTVLNLDVQNTSIATSGTYRRKWRAKSQEVHHIIDPFMGTPVTSDIVSCTVVLDSLVDAELLAKVTLILGAEQGIPWLEAQSTRGWVLIMDDGEVKKSCNL